MTGAFTISSFRSAHAQINGACCGCCLRQLGAGLLYGPAEVLLGVPRRRAHVGQEVLHAGNVIAEQLAVQVARVPVNKDPAHVPQDS